MTTDPPAWRSRAKTKKPPPTKKPLGVESILDAAFAILDHEGLDALSMRRVAQALDTGPASLYAHVENKDELLELMLDRVIGEVPIPVADPARWREQFHRLAHDMRKALVAHPGMAQVTLGRIPTGPNGLVAAEAMMGILASVGVPEKIISFWADLFSLYVGAQAIEETLMLAKYGPTGMSEFLKRIEQIRDYLAQLPADRFPQVTRMAATMMDEEPDDRFDFGLDILLNGLAPYLTKSPAEPPTKSASKSPTKSATKSRERSPTKPKSKPTRGV